MRLMWEHERAGLLARDTAFYLIRPYGKVARFVEANGVPAPRQKWQNYNLDSFGRQGVYGVKEVASAIDKVGVGVEARRAR